MALDTWLIKKVKSALSNRHDPGVAKPNIPPARPSPSVKPPVQNKKPNNNNNHNNINKNDNVLGILSFEIAGLMSKLLHLWHSLSDKSLIRLHNDSILSLDGVRKIVSPDESFLLGLVCAEMVENLRTAAASVARLSLSCDDPGLCEFAQALEEFANTGMDRRGWALGPKEMESVAKKMDRYVKATASLQREIHELAAMESSLRKAVQMSSAAESNSKVLDLRQKILWQREEVKSLRERSLWARSFDMVTLILVQSVFTALARIKLAFCLGGRNYPSTLPCSLSASAAVHPGPHQHTCSMSGPLKPEEVEENTPPAEGFFGSNSKVLKPPESTLGNAALAHHYAGLIIVIEKMIRSPHLIGLDEREDLYSMLPGSIRSALRNRLRGARMWVADPGLAVQWREAMGRILGWLSPLAHNTIKWQSERSFEQQNLVQRMNKISNGSNSTVFLLQTLHFANKEKAEAAITELLVGLNYIWRFEREMMAKALFDCANKQHHL
ncbi:uncharacterized protein LOC116204420 [Punica granatum]|uniref:Uncharacterized protein LOC116204420 n=1 Tax=Punica granatum TaxID=22663 RepID=A0A218X2Q3_PUNGR|nr:uncharacterized protein LOC116204420 [Punica granatum]OWM79475.1 hypothetical protein CDL15_Pgr022887 [Punica granatum]